MSTHPVPRTFQKIPASSLLSLSVAVLLSACGNSGSILPIQTQGLNQGCPSLGGTLIDHGDLVSGPVQEILYQNQTFQISTQSTPMAKLFLSRIHQLGKGKPLSATVCFNGNFVVEPGYCTGIDCPPVPSIQLEAVGTTYPLIQ
jgi:hypothetical protein